MSFETLPSPHSALFLIMSGKLYVTGVPIGNFDDISYRAAEILKKVDMICAEDPRVTVKLLKHLGIEKRCVLYADFLRCGDGESPAECLLRGGECALVSDAGMPVIADPGFDFVSFCRQNGISVLSVPGPCAAMAALSVCGLNVSRFTFEGFLTVNKPNRVRHLNEIKDEKRAMVFYEAAKKLPATLSDLYSVLGDRRCAIVKEITKPAENCELSTLKDASEKYAGARLKGEYVLVIESL